MGDAPSRDAISGIEATVAATERHTRPTRGDDGTLGAGDTLGRYVVLSRLGAGGMGEVYSAYDPELDRRIALKVIRPPASGDQEDAVRGRARLVAEAQALAKLAHPNVVAVYDVGTYGDDVYIAMEYVAGITLTAWCVGRAWREIVEAFVAAGRGLEAAHAEGIVHRDIKPDNIIVGKDGRVRIIDFGVALAGRPGEDASGLVGTPAYMAPEQFLGEELGPHTDQFSFGVALFEMLWGVRPFAGKTVRELSDAVCAGSIVKVADGGVPANVRTAVHKALATRPADRHASMTALLAAITPAVPRRRAWGQTVAIGGAAIGAAVIAVVATRKTKDPPCTGLDAELANIWDDRRKATLQSVLEPASHDSWRAVERVFDDYATAWVESKTAACRATRVTREQPADVLATRNACLDARRRELDATITVIGAGGEAVGHAIEIATGMRSLAHCDNLTAIGRGGAPAGAAPADVQTVQDGLAKLEALRNAAEYKQAHAAADALIPVAERIGWTSAVATALVARGLVEVSEGDPSDARETLFEALRRGVEADDLRRQAEAWIALVGVEASGTRQPGEAMRWARHAETALARAGGDAEMQGQLLHNTAIALQRLERHDDALDREQQALALFQRSLGQRHYRVAMQRAAVGNAYRNLGQLDLAIKEGQAALNLAEQVLGANHPALASTLSSLALSYDEAERYAEARALLERALAVRKPLGAGHPSIATTLVHLAALDRHAGNFDASDARLREAYDIRVAALGIGHPDVTRVLYHELLDRAGRGLDNEGLDLARDIVIRLLTQLDPVELSSTLGIQCELQRRAELLDEAEDSCANAVAALGTTPDPARALYVHAYAARLAIALGDIAVARDHVERARAYLPHVTQSVRMARAFLAWAAAFTDALDMRPADALAEATAARADFMHFGKERSAYLADLAATFDLR